MIDKLIYFFTDPVAKKVLLGVAVIGGVSGMVGCFAFLRKKTLVGDAISHSVLPGICVGFIFAGTKDPLALMTGSLLFGWLSVWFIDYISRIRKLSEDTAIALTSTFFFALGSVMLSFISHSTNSEQSGLKDYLFGKAATMTTFDVEVFGFVFILIIILIILFFKPFQLISFNIDYARSIGVKVNRVEFLISTLTVLAVAIGIQAVGVVLMSALLIAPAATARYWTHKLTRMIFLSTFFGIFAGIAGVMLSTIKDNMPTGPWIVCSLFVLTFLTLIFAPNRGWYSIYKRNKQNIKKIANENVLKTFFHLKEEGKTLVVPEELMARRNMDTELVEITIKRLIKLNFVERSDFKYKLTDTGEKEAARIVRSHRLWEMYLSKRMNFKEDHLHDSAESIEHLITPEIEEELMKDLDFPVEDPHNKKIPY